MGPADHTERDNATDNMTDSPLFNYRSSIEPDSVPEGTPLSAYDAIALSEETRSRSNSSDSMDHDFIEDDNIGVVRPTTKRQRVIRLDDEL